MSMLQAYQVAQAKEAVERLKEKVWALTVAVGVLSVLVVSVLWIGLK